MTYEEKRKELDNYNPLDYYADGLYVVGPAVQLGPPCGVLLQRLVAIGLCIAPGKTKVWLASPA